MRKAMTIGTPTSWMLKVLGRYIFVLGCCQVVVVTLAYRYDFAARITYWYPIIAFAGIWHVLFGAIFLRRKPLLKTYIVSDFLLCLPNVYNCFTSLLFWHVHAQPEKAVILIWVLLGVQTVLPMALAAACLWSEYVKVWSSFPKSEDQV